MKIYRIANESVTIYHVTTKSNAEKIMSIGFDPRYLENTSGSFFFTNEEGIKKWSEKLRSERMDADS